MYRMRKVRMVRPCVLFATVVVLVLTSPISLASDCDATASATLVHSEESHLQFEVEVSTDADRAEVEYDLIIEIALPNGQAKRIRKTGQVKMAQGMITVIVEHKLDEDESMLSYEAKIVKCKSKKM